MCEAMPVQLQVVFFRTVGHWFYARLEELERPGMVAGLICLVGQLDAEAECWRIIRQVGQSREVADGAQH